MPLWNISVQFVDSTPTNRSEKINQPRVDGEQMAEKQSATKTDGKDTLPITL